MTALEWGLLLFMGAASVSMLALAALVVAFIWREMR